MDRSPIRYQASGFALLRLSTDPGGLGLPADLELDGDPDRVRLWMAMEWRRPEIHDAVEAASAVLSAQITAILSGETRSARRIRRAGLSLASYLLRWQGRPTPFGLFAGVVPVRFGTTARVRLGDRHSTRVRADAEWLADVIIRLERCPRLLERLSVVANDAGHARGHRYVVPGRPADGSAELMPPVEVSVRRSRPVTFALEHARTPTRYGGLRDRMREALGASASRIDSLLGQLIAQNVLITELHAPMTCVDELDYLGAVLESVDAAAVPEAADLVRRVYDVREEMAKQEPTARWFTRSDLIERMRTVSDIAPVPLIGDTEVDADVRLPAEVAREAERAVETLYRLTPHPFGHPHWRDYHRRFRARYGVGAVVPVLDLVADSGLGFPAGYLDSPYGRAPRQVSARDEKLLALVQRAILDGREEIELTDAVLAELQVAEPTETIPGPRAEIAVEIHAKSRDELARGSFRLVVTGTPRPGSSMAGRFAHLLPYDDRERLAATYSAADSDAVAAQLSFAPRRRRNENIARTLPLLPSVIPIGEHRPPADGVISLGDLAVTADARRFRLIELSTGRFVEPRVPHALEAGVHTPPLARFLAEITTARCPVYTAVDFGAAAHLPYLPRLRYRRTILAPARWLLTADELPGPSSSSTEWNAELRAWQARLRVPDRVRVVDDNQRLPLDLAQPVDRLLLRRRLNGARRLELREAPDSADLGWLGRAHELLLPVVLNGLPASIERAHGDSGGRTAARLPVAVGELPARSAVLCARLYAHPARYDEILTEHLPELVAALPARSEGSPTWWYRRHRETSRPEADQYLVLYVRLPDAGAYGACEALVTTWAERLREGKLVAGLSFVPYRPQHGRFGHGPAMEAAEQVFTADCAAALAQLGATVRAEVSPQALAAASMVDLASQYAPTAETGLRWLVDHLAHEHVALDRELRDATLALTDPEAGTDVLTALPGGPIVTAAWRHRATVLSTYRARLAEQRDPLTVLRTLLHQHHARALPVDPDVERVTNRLARACAQRWLHSRRSPA